MTSRWLRLLYPARAEAETDAIVAMAREALTKLGEALDHTEHLFEHDEGGQS